MRAFFIGSTGQHEGKTTTCLGLLSGLKKRVGSVGFMKPIGQEHVEVSHNVHVDKDVVLFKEHFNLPDAYSTMSPVLLPSGFTRDYLDGKIQRAALSESIVDSYNALQKNHRLTVIEGTGHIGVGSIIGLNNAQVASLLNLDVILVGSGGLGSTFDALAVNKAMCDQYGIKIAGVILNRVLDDKREMVITYMKKALTKWNIPLLGCIPYDPFLSNPSFKDFEILFNTTLLSGEEHLLRHFRHTRLVESSTQIYEKLIMPSQLILTPSNREDIILTTLAKHKEKDLQAGMILTGDLPPQLQIVEKLKNANIPMLYTPLDSYGALTKIMSYTAKIRNEDHEKVAEAIQIVEKHLDFEALCTLFA